MSTPEELIELHPNLGKVKQELTMTAIRQGFTLEKFEATESPSDGVFVLTVEVKKV